MAAGLDMTYEEAAHSIPIGRYRHFKGKEYEVIAIARHSETSEPMVIYKALYGEGGIWVRPANMWNETVERDGKIYRKRRFSDLVAYQKIFYDLSLFKSRRANARRL